MSFIDERKEQSAQAAKMEQMCVLNKQIFASTAIIYAVLIIIMTLKGYKRILCIDDLEEIERITVCNNELTRYTILIVLIVTFYYLYQAIESYQASSSCTDRNYVVANILSVLATIIRFWTIYSPGNKTLNEEETETEII